MKKLKNHKLIKLLRTPGAQMAYALILFIVSAILARGPITELETTIFYAFYDLPRFLWPLFIVVTQFGGIPILGVFAAIYLFKKHYTVVIRLLMVGSTTFLLSGLAKELWGRARPDLILTDIVTLDFAHGPGFPSGHTALATALALTMSYYLLPRMIWVPIVWIVGVAISRMYLGVHLPLDIVGGFALGWFCYALFRHVRVYDIVPRHRKPPAS